jgi:hypothetical protein
MKSYSPFSMAWFSCRIGSLKMGAYLVDLISRSFQFCKTNLSMKEGNLFVLFILHVEISQTKSLLMCSCYCWEALYEYRYTKLVSWCFEIWWRNYWMNKIFIKNSFKWKLKLIREFGQTIDIIEKPLMSRI